MEQLRFKTMGANMEVLESNLVVTHTRWAPTEKRQASPIIVPLGQIESVTFERPRFGQAWLVVRQAGREPLADNDDPLVIRIGTADRVKFEAFYSKLEAIIGGALAVPPDVATADFGAEPARVAIENGSAHDRPRPPGDANAEGSARRPSRDERKLARRLISSAERKGLGFAAHVVAPSVGLDGQFDAVFDPEGVTFFRSSAPHRSIRWDQVRALDVEGTETSVTSEQGRTSSIDHLILSDRKHATHSTSAQSVVTLRLADGLLAVVRGPVSPSATRARLSALWSSSVGEPCSPEERGESRPEQVRPQESQSTLAGDLQRLADLFQSDLISAEEFAAAKRRLIDEP